MKIVVNGKSEKVCADTVADYIHTRGLDSETLVVAHNDCVIKQRLWEETRLCEGDHLELLSFVGGG